jgi:amino acid permease
MLDDFKIEQNRAEEARKLQEQMMIKSQAAMASNLAMSQRTPNLQISPASQTPQTAGTQPFKRRKLQMMQPGSQILSGLNIGTSNLLNI